MVKLRLALTSTVCIVLLSTCNTTRNSGLSPKGEVEPLTRIARDNEGVLVTSKPIEISRGQIIFIPVYSHIYVGSSSKPEQYLLAATLSIRNTSLTDPIVVRSVRYYNSGGKLVKENTEGHLQLAPLATVEFFIPEQDTSGGSGGNFIVEWVTGQENVTDPFIEAVMVSTRLQQGISFTTPGQIIQKIPEK